MTIDQLNIFISLATLLHFRKASERHHITVSTLTRFIQRLELELQTTLFERNNRKVKLTQAGHIFYEYAKTSVAAYHQMYQQIHPHVSKQLKGEIKLYSTVTAAYYILPPIIKAFREEYPELITYLETGEVKQGYEKLLNHDIDFSVGIITPKNRNQCLCKKVLETPLVYIYPMQHEGTNLTELPMILPEKGDLSQIIDVFLNKQPHKHVVHSYVKGHEAILAMVSAGVGAAILPKIVVEHSHLSKSVKIQDLGQQLPILEVGIFMKKQSLLSPSKKVFWEFLQSMGSDPSVERGASV